MATFFGEVVYPNSRAFWTEDEDYKNSGSNKNSPAFIVKWEHDKPKKIKNLIVAETKPIVGFIERCVMRDPKLLVKKECTVLSTIYPNSHASRLHKITDDLYFLLVVPDVDLTQAGDFVESIASILEKCENIVAITSNHISQLKTISESSAPSFLRTLCTRKFSNHQKLSTSTLKQPNIVSGIAAGVVAYAEVMDISAILNVLYLDGSQLDSKSAEPLIKLFSDVADYKFDELTSFGEKYYNKGNLYM